MFSKLFNAVLVLGFILALFGTAFSGDNPALPAPERRANVVQNISPGAKLDLPNQSPPLQLPAPEQLQTMGRHSMAPAVETDIDTTASYCQNYVDAAGTAFWFSWGRAGGDLRELAMRMDVPENYIATIDGAYVYIWESQAADGGNDLVLTIYEDDGGGLPGAVIHSESFPIGLIPDGSDNYYWFGFAAPPVVAAQVYHIGMRVAGTGNDTTWLCSDDGGHPGYGGTATGTGRGSYYNPGDGFWYHNMDLLGFDPNYDIYSCQTINYTECYWVRTVAPGYVSLYVIPDPDGAPTGGDPPYDGWPDGGVYNGNAQRYVFSTEGRDTLSMILIPHIDYLAAAGWDHYPAGSTNDLILRVYNDDGTGNVDLAGGHIAEEVISGVANLFPAGYGMSVWQYLYVDMSAHNLVLEGPYHVSIQMSSDDPADGMLIPTFNTPSSSPNYNPGHSGGSVRFSGISPEWERTGTSNNWLLEGGGEEQAAYFRFYLCKDEFYNCQTQLTYNAPWVWGWYVYPNGNFMGLGQKIKAPSVNRIEKVRFQVVDPSYWGEPSPVNAKLQINVWETGGTSYEGAPAPGALLYSQTITAPIGAPLFNEMVIPGGLQHVGDFYIGAEAVDVTATDYYYWCTEDALWPGGENNGGALCRHGQIGGAWVDFSAQWGYVDNIMAEADFCAIPIIERLCSAGEDWPTAGKDFARTSASFSSIGGYTKDLGGAQGILTKAWMYEATQVCAYAAPVIYKDTVVCYFLDNLVALDLNTGTEIWKRTLDGFEIGGGAFSTPTVYNFADFGMDVTLVFTCGGDAKSFNAINLVDGTTWWTRNFMAHSMHFMTFGVSVIVDCDGTPVIIYPDDDGDIYAVNALTGALYGGWVTNPQNFGGLVYRGVTSDGTNLYVGTGSNVTNGNITCVDACTGAINWDLQSTAGLQLGNVDPPNAGSEDFTGMVTYDVVDNVPTVFAVSVYDPGVATPPYEAGGVIYSLNAGSGALNWAKKAIGQDYNGVNVDAAQVINNGWTPWVPGYGVTRGPTAYSKTAGSKIWENTTTNPGLGDFWMMEGALSCEPEGLPDWYVVMSRNNFVGFYRSTDGAMMFHRRIAESTRAGHRVGTIMSDGHLLATYRWKMVCLTPQELRPRLDLPAYTINVPVQFGMPDHTPVTYEDALGNLGGAPLTIDSIRLGDDDQGTTPPPSASLNIIDFDRLETMDKIASKFASNSDKLRASFRDDDVVASESARSSRNNAAFVIPAWVYGVTAPVDGTVIPPQAEYNDSSAYIDIVLDVNATLIPRGYHQFYAYIYHDDPDYFLDTLDDKAAPVAQIMLGIIGGCLYEDVTIEFGDGILNWAVVWNATKIADGDITSWEIDGDDVSFWQGAYIFATDQTGTSPRPFSVRVAHYAANWSAANPMNWQSILGDPNCQEDLCPPYHQTNVLLGTISTDEGENYDDVYGELVCYAFVDSVEDMCEYDTLGNCVSWDWNYAQGGVQPPYNDTLTMGFHACAAVIGAYDQPLLNNFVIHRFDFDGRYGPVNDVYMGAMIDYDIPPDNTYNVAGYDEDLSLAWAYNCNIPDNGWGMVKIPFGGGGAKNGGTPMINAKSISANQGGWNDSSVWLDSVYYWMSTLTGLSHQTGIDPVICPGDPDDREVFFTIAELDIPAARDVLTIGVAVFGMPDIVDADLAATYAELAHTANKWCGFDRGDVNNDGNIGDLVDIAYLIYYIGYGGNGPYPFWHLGDVNCDEAINSLDVEYLIAYRYGVPQSGPPPCGKWMLACD